MFRIITLATLALGLTGGVALADNRDHGRPVITEHREAVRGEAVRGGAVREGFRGGVARGEARLEIGHDRREIRRDRREIGRDRFALGRPGFERGHGRVAWNHGGRGRAGGPRIR